MKFWPFIQQSLSDADGHASSMRIMCLYASLPIPVIFGAVAYRIICYGTTEVDIGVIIGCGIYFVGIWYGKIQQTKIEMSK